MSRTRSNYLLVSFVTFLSTLTIVAVLFAFGTLKFGSTVGRMGFGTISVYAEPCQPVIRPGQISYVTVEVRRATQLIVSSTAAGPSRFAFNVAPGQYLVSSNGGSFAKPTVTVHRDQVVKVNLPSSCR